MHSLQGGQRVMHVNSFSFAYSFTLFCTANVRGVHMSVEYDACLLTYSTFVHVHCFEEVAINLTTKTTNEPQSFYVIQKKQIFYRWDFHWVLIFSCLASIIRIKQRVKDEKQKQANRRKCTWRPCTLYGTQEMNRIQSKWMRNKKTLSRFAIIITNYRLYLKRWSFCAISHLCKTNKWKNNQHRIHSIDWPLLLLLLQTKGFPRIEFRYRHRCRRVYIGQT